MSKFTPKGDNHKISYARQSRQCAALLHHKLLREALEA